MSESSMVGQFCFLFPSQQKESVVVTSAFPRFSELARKAALRHEPTASFSRSMMRTSNKAKPTLGSKRHGHRVTDC